VPVRLYAAVRDRDVPFRLLHRKDHVPVRQAMADSERDQAVPDEEALRAWPAGDGRLVILDDEDLRAVAPRPSPDIEVLRFLPAATIDHRWYVRPYYLGADDDDGRYAAFVAALTRSGREGLVRWVMRRREHLGALRLHRACPVLILLRHVEEIVPAEQLEAPTGRRLDERELSMARRLIESLGGPFLPDRYRDRYREQLLDLIETKRRGGNVRKTPPHRPAPVQDLTSALENSLARGLEQERKHVWRQ
jgi:DNA end-binding protein Ku